MAAEVLSTHGLQVDLYDSMPSVGRKFLLAGKGGLNLTHSEPAETFIKRYGNARHQVSTWLKDFDAQALCEWVHALGIETFVGSSGRVFPKEMKAAPLLRAWLQRLRHAGVRFHMRHRWIGWSDAEDSITLRFENPQGEHRSKADVVILALGGGSWKRLGSDGAWLLLLEERSIGIAALQAANCGFNLDWSAHFRQRFAGRPLKDVRLDFGGQNRQGELLISEYGVEGSLIYAFSAALRETINADGSALLHLDLAPAKSLQRLEKDIAHPRGSRSMSSHLASRVGIDGVKAGLLRECVPRDTYENPYALAQAIKALPLRLTSTRPIDEAISSAGGVRFDELNEALMLKKMPGVFCAGEMLDWEAPTGGYLLTACIASGRYCALGALRYLKIL
jgi:uncharacterized flavoprotein (TIGR03862 family)